MKSPYITLLVGIALGICLTIFLSSFFAESTKGSLFQGVLIGFGGGFGSVAAVLAWNKLIGYLDRLSSGKA